MKTTVLIVEFLVAGTLVVLAVGVFLSCFFQSEMQRALTWLNQYQDLAAPLATIIFVAIAYSVGVLLESIGLELFEWKLDEIKTERMKKYLKENQKDLKNSSIFNEYAGDPEKISKDQAVSWMGDMRFYVLMKSPTLYEEIESQINRLRLVRVSFLAEFILIVAVILRLRQNPSLFLDCILLFLMITAILTVWAIMKRFHRYCRAIERSYKMLVLEKS